MQYFLYFLLRWIFYKFRILSKLSNNFKVMEKPAPVTLSTRDMDRMEELDSISVEHNEMLAPMNISVNKPHVTPKESKRRDKVKETMSNTD